MASLTLRGLFARKLRVVLTSLAVILGVMMISGTYVFTDTINHSFDTIFKESNKGTDVVVKSKQAFTTDSGTLPPPFPESLLGRIQRVNGVGKAAGSVSDYASIFLDNGKQVETTGAPPLLFSNVPEPFNPLDYVKGAAPTKPNQVAIDKGTASKKGIEVGDTIKLVGKAPARAYQVSGIAKFGSVSSIGNATIAIVTLPEAQRISDKGGHLDQVSIADAPGFSEQQVVQNVQRILPATVEAKTGTQDANDQSQEVRDSLGFLNIALLVFAGVAVFVGGFIIFNTFSITVTQRTKEFALLRTMGASGGQVMRSVLLESLLIGVVASAIGTAVGVVAAKGISAMFRAIGIDLPQQGTVIETRTIVVAMVVGVLVTLVAGVIPARRATRVPPLAAMREDAMSARKGRSSLRLVIASILLAVGVLVVALGLFGGGDSTQVLSTLGGGAILIFISIAMLSRWLVRPLASAVGRPLRAVRGLEGQLARENTMRNPSRTAVTAAALMIGLALITFVSVLAAGIKASVSDTIDKNMDAELVLQNTQGSFLTIPAAVGRKVANVDGVESVSPVKSTNVEVQTDGAGKTLASGIDPPTINDVWNFAFTKGSEATLARLGPDQVVLNAKYASSKGFGVGDRLKVKGSTGTAPTFEVAATIDDDSGFLGKVVFTNETMSRAFGEREDNLVLVRTTPGVPVSQVQDRVDKLLKAEYPTAESQNQGQFKDEIQARVDKLVMLFYALLSLSIIVSLFGIVNTLVLSITERTRELGMMRAIGTSRRQVRRVVRYESVITALIGGTLGLVVGLALGLGTTFALQSEGFKLSVPFLQLLAFFVLAGVAGVLAAIPPARRASRIDVLEALAYE